MQSFDFERINKLGAFHLLKTKCRTELKRLRYAHLPLIFLAFGIFSETYHQVAAIFAQTIDAFQIHTNLPIDRGYPLNYTLFILDHLTMSKNETLFERAQRTTPGGEFPLYVPFAQLVVRLVLFNALRAPLFGMQMTNNTSITSVPGDPAPGAHPPEVILPYKSRRERPQLLAHQTAEILMAEEICKLVPSIEQVDWSPVERSHHSALRCTRRNQTRPKLSSSEGCYHGHADALLVKAGSGLLTWQSDLPLAACLEDLRNTPLF